MKRIYISLFILLSIVTKISAQESHHDEHKQHEHPHPQNEIGMVHAPVYLFNDKKLAYALHLHLIHRIKNTKLGYGLGYERIFDEHGHNMIGVVGNYYPIDPWSISITPGVMFEDATPSELHFALHLETLYEFEINVFHIGPALELAYTPEDLHISLGLHVAYAF